MTIMMIPLHPGTHLTHRTGLEILRDSWVCATPAKRAEIINSIVIEIEFYGDCYRRNEPIPNMLDKD